MSPCVDPTFEFLDYCEQQDGALDENTKWQVFGVPKTKIERLTELEKGRALRRASNYVVNHRIKRAQLDREYAKYCGVLCGDRFEIPDVDEARLRRETIIELNDKWSAVTLRHHADF